MLLLSVRLALSKSRRRAGCMHRIIDVKNTWHCMQGTETVSFFRRVVTPWDRIILLLKAQANLGG